MVSFSFMSIEKPGDCSPSLRVVSKRRMRRAAVPLFVFFLITLESYHNDRLSAKAVGLKQKYRI
jgi:hypothetical protein